MLLFRNVHRLFVSSALLAFAVSVSYSSRLRPRARKTTRWSQRFQPVSCVHAPVRGGGAEFLGIPYAQPPVGNLRWRAPVPPRPWTGIRNATTFWRALPAAGAGRLESTWRCRKRQRGLSFPNVITPAWPAAKLLPVMVWLHGGANIGGSSGSGLYNEGTLPGHGAVPVTLNYRLGVFGFMADPALARASLHHAADDYGLLDQILALRWVRANIARFGDDPGNVTLFGQSAGSMDTGILMTSPLARGLFQKAIAESGAAFSPPVVPLAQAEQTGEAALAERIRPQERPASARCAKCPHPSSSAGWAAHLQNGRPASRPISTAG